MPNPNISKHANKFTSEYQPKNRRKSTKFLTALLTKNLNRKAEVVLEGFDLNTGEKRKIRVENPNQQVIVMALLQKAAAGDVSAIREVWNRIEGLPALTGEIDLPGITRIGFDDGPED